MKFIQLDNKYEYVPDFNCIINIEIKNTFLKYADRLKKVVISEININKETINREFKKLRQITFETTQDCNLNCKYCVYNKLYYYTRRENTKYKYLKFETAKKALDYIFTIIKEREKKEIAIGFYGGEPLLNYETIKKIVEYLKKKYKDWNIIFNITTNGTLLKKNVIDFLISHKFRTLVSLDGPEEIHNSKRIFKSGKGSFDIIIKNLQQIKKINRHYFENYIGLSIVWSYDLSLDKIYNFFINNELLNKSAVRLSPVAELDTDYYEVYDYDVNLAKIENEEIQKTIKNKVKIGKKLLPLEKSLLHDPIMEKLSSTNYTLLFGACFFNARFFIDVDGRFHICHMMNDKFSFGNIWEGLNFMKMQKILEDYINLNKQYCLECDFRYLCQRCFVPFAKEGRFEIDKKFCTSMKNSIIPRLKRYITLKEEGII